MRQWKDDKIGRWRGKKLGEEGRKDEPRAITTEWRTIILKIEDKN